MTAQSYRQQGSDQAVRIVFQPCTSPLRSTAQVGLALLGFGALVWGALSGLWAPLALIVVLAALQEARQKTYEVFVDGHEVRTRWRTWPLLWREKRLLKTSVSRVLVEDEPWKPTYGLSLQLRDGTSADLLRGLDLDQPTADQIRETIERALDPSEIDNLIAEHAEAQQQQQEL